MARTKPRKSQAVNSHSLPLRPKLSSDFSPLVTPLPPASATTALFQAGSDATKPSNGLASASDAAEGSPRTSLGKRKATSTKVYAKRHGRPDVVDKTIGTGDDKNDAVDDKEAGDQEDPVKQAHENTNSVPLSQEESVPTVEEFVPFNRVSQSFANAQRTGGLGQRRGMEAVQVSCFNEFRSYSVDILALSAVST